MHKQIMPERIEQDNLFSILRFIFILNMFLCMTSVVYCRTFFYILCRRYLIILKTNSENVSSLNVGVLNFEFALKLSIYRSLKSVSYVSNESERSFP